MKKLKYKSTWVKPRYIKKWESLLRFLAIWLFKETNNQVLTEHKLPCLVHTKIQYILRTKKHLQKYIQARIS